MRKLAFIIAFWGILSGCSNTGGDGGTSSQVVAPDGNDIWVITEQSEPDTLKGSLKAKAMGSVGNIGITINYYSPSVRGRVIWGGLVPFDNVWVTGAHRTTTIEFNQEVEVGGVLIAPGKYGFFTIPGKDEWILIINRTWDQHLADDYDQKDDVVRVGVQPAVKEVSQERLRYTIKSQSDTVGEIVVNWENLEVSLPVKPRS
jgi:hypothetical protein